MGDARRGRKQFVGGGPDPETAFHLQAAQMLRLGIAPGQGFFFHVPNQGKRSPVLAQLFKGMGMLPGVTDLVLIRAMHPHPIGTASAGFLELKRPDGTGSLSKAQVEFRDRCQALNIPWAEARTLDEVAAFARQFYGPSFRVTIS